MTLRGRGQIRQNYGNKRTVAPAEEPVTLTEVKTHLRINNADSDGYLISLISTARQILEQISGIAFVTQTWVMTLDAWPGYKEDPWWDGVRQGSIGDLRGMVNTVVLPVYPLQSISEVLTYDLDSNSTAIVVADTFDIDTNSIRGRMTLKYGQTWPVALRRTNAVQITYVAGYGLAADVPAPLKEAVNKLIAYLFDHRGNCGMHDAYNKSGAAEILRLYRDMSV